MSDRTFGFVLGTGRCGSTLVQELLARHHDVGFVSNIEDRLPRLDIGGAWNGPIYRRLPPKWAEKARLRFAPTEGYRVLDRHVAPIISTPRRDLTAADATPWLADRFRRFFETRADAQGAPVFLHKFTGWPRAGFVAAALPGSRFVHIVRDGRAVANSLLQMDWWRGYQGPEGWQFGPLPEAYAAEWEASGRSFVVLAGLEWMLLLDAFEAARAAVDADAWLQVHYEDLVVDPKGTIATMLDFLGLELDAEFLAQMDRYHFDPTRQDAYRRDLDRASLAQLERALAGHLKRYGYEAS